MRVPRLLIVKGAVLMIAASICSAQPSGPTPSSKTNLKLFVGTWKLDPTQSELIETSLIEKTANGLVHINDYGEYTVALDGTEASTSGGNKITCTEVNSRVWQCRVKGRVNGTLRRELSSDGKSIIVTSEGTADTGDGTKPFSIRRILQRIGPGDGFYGKWKRIPDESMTFGTMNCTVAGDTISMKFDAAGGNSLTISGKLNGPETPLQGLPGGTVSLTGVNERSIETVLKRNGKLMERSELLLSADRKTLTDTDRSPEGKVNSVFVYRKQ